MMNTEITATLSRPNSGPQLRASIVEATRTAIARARIRRDVVREHHLIASMHELEPSEPRWVQQLGNVLRKLGRDNEAASAYRHAAQLYSSHGFAEHADAMRFAARRAA